MGIACVSQDMSQLYQRRVTTAVVTRHGSFDNDNGKERKTRRRKKPRSNRKTIVKQGSLCICCCLQIMALALPGRLLKPRKDYTPHIANISINILRRFIRADLMEHMLQKMSKEAVNRQIMIKAISQGNL